MKLVPDTDSLVPLKIHAKLTAEGVRAYRIPGAKEGDRFEVDSLTAGVCGDYWNCHVRDDKGNIWSLGDGQWEPAGSEYNQPKK